MTLSKVHAIIVAGGKGSRLKSDLPKQYIPLNGKPVLMHTLQRFRDFPLPVNLVTVISREMESYWCELCEKHDFPIGKIAYGGPNRWDSVKSGFEALGFPHPDDIVLIHDAARPFVSYSVINDIIESVGKGVDGAIPVVDVTDSIRCVTDKGTSECVDRNKLRSVQTPQGFTYSKLKKAFELPFSPAFTDEASMMEAAGFANIELIKGDERNFKITRPVDMALAQIMVADA